MAPKTAQDRPKTSPRSSWFGFFGSCFFASILIRYRIDFGVVLASKMEPRGHARALGLAPGGVQDGLEIVLVRFSCRLVVRDRFFCPLGLVLGSFLGAPGVVLVLWGAS